MYCHSGAFLAGAKVRFLIVGSAFAMVRFGIEKAFWPDGGFWKESQKNFHLTPSHDDAWAI